MQPTYLRCCGGVLRLLVLSDAEEAREPKRNALFWVHLRADGRTQLEVERPLVAGGNTDTSVLPLAVTQPMKTRGTGSPSSTLVRGCFDPPPNCCRASEASFSPFPWRPCRRATGTGRHTSPPTPARHPATRPARPRPPRGSRPGAEPGCAPAEEARISSGPGAPARRGQRRGWGSR